DADPVPACTGDGSPVGSRPPYSLYTPEPDRHQKQQRGDREAQRVEGDRRNLAERSLDDAVVAAPDDGHQDEQRVEAGEVEAHGRVGRARPTRPTRLPGLFVTSCSRARSTESAR